MKKNRGRVLRAHIEISREKCELVALVSVFNADSREAARSLLRQSLGTGVSVALDTSGWCGVRARILYGGTRAVGTLRVEEIVGDDLVRPCPNYEAARRAVAGIEMTLENMAVLVKVEGLEILEPKKRRRK